MDCHQKIKLALAADLLIAQQVMMLIIIYMLVVMELNMALINKTLNRQSQKRKRQRHHLQVPIK